MKIIKKLIPNKIKQEGKYFLYTLLKIPYNRYNLPVEIPKWLPDTDPIFFIDIGASRGSFSASLSRNYRIGGGILVEPLPTLILHLKNSFKDENIYSILNIAVSDKKGEATFFFAEDFDVMSSLLEIKNDYYKSFHVTSSGKELTVKTQTLDDIARFEGDKPIDLIKIDVQGAEHLVLNSGINTLKKTKMVYIEVSYKALYEGSSTFFDIFKILNDNDFRFVEHTLACERNGEILQADALFINNTFYPIS